MQPASVVPALDVGEQVALGLVAGDICPVVHQLGFQRVAALCTDRLVGAETLGRVDGRLLC